MFFPGISALDVSLFLMSSYGTPLWRGARATVKDDETHSVILHLASDKELQDLVGTYLANHSDQFDSNPKTQKEPKNPHAPKPRHR